MKVIGSRRDQISQSVPDCRNRLPQ